MTKNNTIGLEIRSNGTVCVEGRVHVDANLSVAEMLELAEKAELVEPMYEHIYEISACIKENYMPEEMEANLRRMGPGACMTFGGIKIQKIDEDFCIVLNRVND